MPVRASDHAAGVGSRGGVTSCVKGAAVGSSVAGAVARRRLLQRMLWMNASVFRLYERNGAAPAWTARP